MALKNDEGHEPKGIYEVIISKPAAKVLQSLADDYILKIEKQVNALAENPRPRGCEKLSGTDNRYRIRVGVYRIIYSVYDAKLVIDILYIDHRKNIYKKR